METLQVYKPIKALILVCFCSVFYHYLELGLLPILYMVMPYIVVFVLANQTSYNSPLKIYSRAIASVFVAFIALGLIFGSHSKEQLDFPIVVAVLLQYGALMLVEVVIALLIYGEFAKD